MQFHQASGSKIRPALVLGDPEDDDFLAAPITSQAWASEFDLALAEWKTAGLDVPSTARIHKLTVLAKDYIVRRLGICSSRDRDTLAKLLCRIFCPV
jgi:hypothetical protein